MLRKILTVAFVAAILFSFGCKKTTTETQTKSSVQIKQGEKDGQATTETIKKETIKQTETTLKDVNAK
jgi:hypothetical protein